MKKEVLIGILAIVAIVIAGCTAQTQESPTRQSYSQGLTDCIVFEVSGYGEPACNDLGYVCVAEEGEETLTYLTSTDGLCSGETQMRDSSESWGECQNFGGSDAGCTRRANGVEPYFGDVIDSSVHPAPGEHKVICCK